MRSDEEFEAMIVKINRRNEVAGGCGRFLVIIAVLALIALGCVVYYYQFEECTRVHPSWYCI